MSYRDWIFALGFALSSCRSALAAQEGIMEYFLICKCKNVSFFDVEEAVHKAESFPDLESAFKEVQEVTHCSTGCGGCHDKIMDAISQIIYR